MDANLNEPTGNESALTDEKERKQQVVNINREIETLLVETAAAAEEMGESGVEELTQKAKENAKELNSSSVS